MVERLQDLLFSNLGSDGYDKTVRAVNVYKKIFEVLEEARKTATTALEKAIDARQKVFLVAPGMQYVIFYIFYAGRYH